VLISYWRCAIAFLFSALAGAMINANSPLAEPALSEYRGTCDASAAIALVVTIDNPGDVIEGKKPKIGPVLELPLDGLGIRSIERHGDNYLIIAGHHDGNKNSRLFRWPGPSTTATLPTPVPDLEFGDLNPEALFVSAKGQIYILSDDGGKEINGTDCKDAPVEERSFRVKVIMP
jgi:hypothetical protein